MANDNISKEKQKTLQTAWKKLYEKDLMVIGEFLTYLQQTSNKNYRLYFKDGTKLVAKFAGAADSDNGLDLNDPYYEDLYELDFNIKRIEKKGTVLNYRENERISLNYHNFFIKFEPYLGE